MLAGTLQKATMTPLLPNTVVMSQTDMEPAVEERLPWQKITIIVELGWPITPILAVSIVAGLTIRPLVLDRSTIVTGKLRHY